jgi:hypothetical protein
MTTRNPLQTLKAFLLMALVFSAAGIQATEPFSHDAWDNLLKDHVVVINQGSATQVDYAGMANERRVLKQYLTSLGRVSQARFDGWGREQRLAFLINAYNAWTVELILTQYPALGSIKELGSFFQSPWEKRFIPLLGKTRSLDDIEHELIRGSGRFNEPRIHFAVSCASIGCPALRAEAYTGDGLEAQLEEATRSFLRDRSRNRLERGTLRVSRVFDWYRRDFEQGWRGQQTLAQFLAGYYKALGLDPAQRQSLIEGDLELDFLDYDWGLNRKP